MDKNYMDLHLLTDRYVFGKLSQEEEAEFEERLIWENDLADELDLAMQLKDGLRASVADISNLDANTGSGLFARLNMYFEVPVYAAAASFLFAVVLTTGVALNLPGSGGEYPEGASTRTQFIAMPLIRGDGADLADVDKDAWAVLVIELDQNQPFSLYRASVKGVGSKTGVLWMQDDIQPTYLNTLAIGMPGGVLPVGEYIVNVEGIRTSAAGERTYVDFGEFFLNLASME